MNAPHRYVFVGGLHRSGTSVVARLLQEHPDIAGITDAPVPENEGCYLQGAIPHTARHGVPVQFATDPAQHHVEGSLYDTLATRQRLEADWAPWFDPQARWRVEKSPVNCTRMRLYQSLFPLSQFVLVTRHPQYLAAAMRKWSDAGDAAVMDHWERAHAIIARDLTFLHAWLIVRYEDLVRDPQEVRRRLFAFLDLPVCESAIAVRDGNADYADRLPPAPESAPLFYEPDRTLARHPLRHIAEAIAG